MTDSFFQWGVVVVLFRSGSCAFVFVEEMSGQAKTVCVILGAVTAAVALGVGGYFLWKKYPFSKKETDEKEGDAKPEEAKAEEEKKDL